MRYYLIAGEPSGDLHGSHLIRALKAEDSAAEFRAWGGDLMAAAGAQVVKHYRDLAFMGIVSVVANLPTILRNERFCKADIDAFQPDRLILIDYSGFNLRIARWAGPQGMDISYYISPQVWAWRSGRVKHIKAHVKRMLVILPFEEAWYAERGVTATFVGHPLLDVVDQARPQVQSPLAGPLARAPEGKDEAAMNMEARPIALLPGSRTQEITTGLPIMLAAAKRHPEQEYVIAKAPGQEASFYAEFLKAEHIPPRVSLSDGDTYGLLQRAQAALVTSGTATLETALFGVPQIICYKGGWINYQIVKRLVSDRIKYIGLVNLVMDEAMVPELIQEDFNPENLADHLQKIMAGPLREKQLKDLSRLREKLGDGGAAARAAHAIIAT